MVIFLDTYAIIEIDKGNPNYKKYTLKPVSAVTTLLNLIEIHFVYSKNFGKKEADRIFNHIKKIVIPVNDSIIKEATNLKLAHRKKRLSFADCVGYATSKKYSIKFLTGDYQFKNLPQVEFVK